MIWLVGQDGMLGTELRQLLTAQGLAWVGSSRDVDVGDDTALDAFAAALPQTPTWIVNCSAYTAVDKAEDEIAACTRVNVTGAENLARLAHRLGAAILHISTDYVFDGKGLVGTDALLRPYIETDPVGPQGVYGRTKVDGEALVRELCPRHLTLRTAWLYGAAGPNFVFTMLRLMKAKDLLGVVADQFGSPTWTRDLATVMAELLSRPVLAANDPAWGTYHVSGEGQCSWFEFAQAILERGRAEGLLDPASPIFSRR
ncbi:MAG: dTDP-4-dehydrorhamnose reductase [Spirochaetales bacterium]